MISGGMAGATSYLGGMKFLGGGFFATMGQAFINTTASSFVTTMGNRIIEGKSLSLGSAWDGLKSSAIKGTFAGLAAGAAWGIKSLGTTDGVKMVENANGRKFATLAKETSWIANFGAGLASQAINSVGNYAAFKTVDQKRMVKDLIAEGMKPEDAEKMAKEQGKSMVAQSIYGIAISGATQLATAGLNWAIGGSYNKQSGGFEVGDQNGKVWARNDMIQTAFNTISSAAINISGSLIANKITNSDQFSASATLLSGADIGNLLEGFGVEGSFTHNLKSQNMGLLSIGLTGKGAGSLQAGGGNIDFSLSNLSASFRGLQDATFIAGERWSDEKVKGKDGRDYSAGENRMAMVNMMLYSGNKDALDVADKVITGEFKMDFGETKGYGTSDENNKTMILSNNYLSNGTLNGDTSGLTKSVLGAVTASHEGVHLNTPGKNKEEEYAAYSTDAEVWKSLKAQFGNEMGGMDAQLLKEIQFNNTVLKAKEISEKTGNKEIFNKLIEQMADLSGEDRNQRNNENRKESCWATTIAEMLNKIDPNFENWTGKKNKKINSQFEDRLHDELKGGEKYGESKYWVKLLKEEFDVEAFDGWNGKNLSDKEINDILLELDQLKKEGYEVLLGTGFTSKGHAKRLMEVIKNKEGKPVGIKTWDGYGEEDPINGGFKKFNSNDNEITLQEGGKDMDLAAIKKWNALTAYLAVRKIQDKENSNGKWNTKWKFTDFNSELEKKKKKYVDYSQFIPIF